MILSLQTWQETLVTSQVDGTARSSFTTAITVLPDQARYTLPAGFFSAPGKAMRIRAAGRISNVVTAQPTFTYQVQMGPTSNITVFTTGALTTSTTAHTNVPWELEVLLTCRAVGASTTANLMGQARIFSQAFVSSGATADGANTHTMLMAPNTAPAVGTGFDSTVSMVVDLFVACGTSNASNAIQCHQYVLEALN